jgi:hypothetical protein
MPLLDASMILLDTIIQVHMCAMNRLISKGFTYGTGIGAMSVRRDRRWSMSNTCDCSREERFCRIHISFLALAANPPDCRHDQWLDTDRTISRGP